ncbi:MAG: hypothetical protein U5L07_19560 [Desulfobacterales bacterium]|nr:hypothetical protein [Desulfobacterales bacterium]
MTAHAMPYHFETGLYRPPSEGGSNSLLVRFTRNCPWNRCTFCAMYKTEKFALRSLEAIKSDIDAMAAICDELGAISAKSGSSGGISRDAAVKFLGNHPELNYHEGFAMLFNWLISGGRTAFLQDANSLIMKTDDLVAAIREQLLELRVTMEDLDITGRVCFDHAGNYWRDPGGRLVFSHDYEGYRFPDDKPQVLKRIAEGLAADNLLPGFLRF